jgi:hypothetical protein
MVFAWRSGSALDASARKVIANKILDEELREIVKDVYGDEYDAAAVSTCEAALWVTRCFGNPLLREEGMLIGQGILLPMSDICIIRLLTGGLFLESTRTFMPTGCTAGELGFYGKRQYNLDVVIVPLEGAKYECHGLKYHVAPLLMGSIPKNH